MLSAVFMGACTDESRLKKQALEDTRQVYEAVIHQESVSRLSPSSTFKEAYQSSVLSKTSYEYEVLEKSESRAVVKVRVKGVPYKARKALIDILNRNKEKFSFNVADALRLILNELQISDGNAVDRAYRIEFLKNNGQWTMAQRIKDAV
jgi:hypothetical protein